MSTETHDYLAEARALYEQAVEDKRAELAEAGDDPKTTDGYWARRAGRTELADLLLRLDAFDDWRHNRALQQAEAERVLAMSREAERQTAAQESIAESLRIIASPPAAPIETAPETVGALVGYVIVRTPPFKSLAEAIQRLDRNAEGYRVCEVRELPDVPPKPEQGERRCQSTAPLRDEDQLPVHCVLPEGHVDFHSDAGRRHTWTDGGQR